MIEASRSGARPRDVPRSMPSATATWLIPYRSQTLSIPVYTSTSKPSSEESTHENMVVAQLGDKPVPRVSAVYDPRSHRVEEGSGAGEGG